MNVREWEMDVAHRTDLSGVRGVVVELVRRVSDGDGGVVRRDLHQLVFYTVCMYRAGFGEGLTEARFMCNSGGVWSAEVDCVVDELVREGVIQGENVICEGERTEELFVSDGESVSLESGVDGVVMHSVQMFGRVSRGELRSWVREAVPSSVGREVFTQDAVDVPSAL